MLIRRRVVLLGVVVGIALGASHVRAKDDELEPAALGFLFAVRDTPAARFTLEEARDALEGGRTVQALRAIQRVLDTMSNDFYLMPEESSRKSVLWRSAPEVARSLLEGLSPQHRQTYANMTEPQAKPLFERALRAGSEHDLNEVLRRFGASPVGLQAARLLAERALGEGRWRDAARVAREGLRFAPKDAGLWARLLDAVGKLDNHRTLKRMQAPDDVTLGLRGRSRTAKAYLAELLKKSHRSAALRDWPTLAGNASRDAVNSHMPSRPSHLRARERMAFKLREDDPPNRRRNYGFMSGGRSNASLSAHLKTFRPIFPVNEGRNVYACDGRTVRAFDLYSGRKLWQFDARRAPRSLNVVEPHDEALGRTSLERVFSPTVAGDTVVATLEVKRPYERQQLHNVSITTYLPHRVVVALNKHSGALLWSMADKGLSRLTLADESVIAPVAISEGLVIAVTSRHEGNHNVSMMAFDLRSGELRWRRSLGSGQQELNLFGYPIKEPAGTTLAVADGVAYASSGLGFIAAVDIRTGVPRWLASYEIDEIEPVRHWYTAPRRTLRMAPSPAIVRGDALIVAASDAKHVHVYDRNSGVLRWRHPYVRGGMRRGSLGQLIGVANDGKQDVVLVSDARLRALALDGVNQGKEVWWGRFDPEVAHGIGRGAVVKNEVLVPTVEGLQRFSLTGHGKFLGTSPWPAGAAPGNVLALSHVLLISGSNSIQWFFDWKDIERDIATRRRERPKDPSVLIEAGELYLRGGGATQRARTSFTEALRMLKGAANKSLARRAEEGLFRAWMDDARKVLPTNPKKARKHFASALKHAKTPRDITEVRLAQHQAFQGNFDAQAENLRALADAVGDARVSLQPTDAPIPVRAYALTQLAELYLGREDDDKANAKRAVDVYQEIIRLHPKSDDDADMWNAELAAGAIDDVIDEYGREVYAAHERKAQALLKKSAVGGDLDQLDRLLREYPNASAVSQAMVKRAEIQLAGGDAEKASATLRDILSEGTTEDLTPSIVAGLYLCYRELGAEGASRTTAQRLATEFASTSFSWAGKDYTGRLLLKAYPRANPPSKATKPNARPTIEGPLREVHFEPSGEDVARSVLVEMDPDDPGGLPQVPYSVMAFDNNAAAIDLRTGKVAWRQTIVPIQQATYSNGTLVIAALGRFIGLDAATGEQRWDRKISAQHKDLGSIGGVVISLHRPLGRSSSTVTLMAMDARKGIELWKRSFPSKSVRRFSTFPNAIVLEHDRFTGARASKKLVVVDPLSGRTRHEIRLPSPLQLRTPYVDHEICVAVDGYRGRKGARVHLFDMRIGKERFKTTLTGKAQVKAVQRYKDKVYVLRSDGHLVTLSTDNGKILHETRIYLGDGVLVRPFPRTELLVNDTSLMIVPWTSRQNAGVLCYELRSGKLQWELPFAEKMRHSYALLAQHGDTLVSVTSHTKRREMSITLRLVDPNTGNVLFTAKPEGISRANWMPTVIVGYGTLVVYGRSGCSVFRGASEAPLKVR